MPTDDDEIIIICIRSFNSTNMVYHDLAALLMFFSPSVSEHLALCNVFLITITFRL